MILEKIINKNQHKEEAQKPKILLAGSTSNIGNNLIYKLKDYEVYTLGRARGCKFRFDAGKDKVDRKLRKKKFDIIINTIAAFGSNDTDTFYDTEKINALGILRLCEIAKQCEVKHFIHVSSMFSDYKEGDAYYNIYSVSKKHADELLKLYCKKENINYTIIKPSQIYSYDLKSKKHQGFLYSLAKQVLENKEVHIYGTNDFIRNYIHVNDICTIIQKVAKQSIYGEYLTAAIKSSKVSELFNLFKQVAASSSTLTFDNTKPDIQSLPLVSDFALYEKLNWQPENVLENNIEKFLEGVKNG